MSSKIIAWTSEEKKKARHFNPQTDYSFVSRTGQFVTVFNRPDPERKRYGFNSPALKRPIKTKYGSYFVTNQVIIRILTISMTVASLYIFVDLVNTQMLYEDTERVDLLNGPVYAFGTFLKYMC